MQKTIEYFCVGKGYRSVPAFWSWLDFACEEFLKIYIKMFFQMYEEKR